jgi:hypothetical protein
MIELTIGLITDVNLAISLPDMESFSLTLVKALLSVGTVLVELFSVVSSKWYGSFEQSTKQFS